MSHQTIKEMKRLLSMIVFLGALVCWLIFSTSLEDGVSERVTLEQVSNGNDMTDSLSISNVKIDLRN